MQPGGERHRGVLSGPEVADGRGTLLEGESLGLLFEIGEQPEHRIFPAHGYFYPFAAVSWSARRSLWTND